MTRALVIKVTLVAIVWTLPFVAVNSQTTDKILKNHFLIDFPH